MPKEKRPTTGKTWMNGRTFRLFWKSPTTGNYVFETGEIFSEFSDATAYAASGPEFV